MAPRGVDAARCREREVGCASRTNIASSSSDVLAVLSTSLSRFQPLNPTTADACLYVTALSSPPSGHIRVRVATNDY